MHIPVLQKEILQYLEPKPNENFIDATIGGGGHAFAILEKILPNGRLLGIDWDEELIRRLKIKNQKSKIKNNLILVCDNFANLKGIVKKIKFRPVHPVRGQRGLTQAQRKQTSNGVHGILFDLGMSSWHLEESKRGFSFLRKEPLDMRYNIQNPLTAEKIVNYWSVQEIEKILKEYGQEQFAQSIAKKIIETRKIKPIKTTFQLVEIIKTATPGWYHRKKIHLATKTFQALRIAVNDELNNLEKALPQALEVLKKNGRLAVISFHSLEDRIVKNFYRSRASIDLRILTKKPITPSREEIKINPRSRSAKLRAAIKN